MLLFNGLALDLQYINAELPAESPYLYGLHPNAEIGFLTQTSEKLFRMVLELQPRDSQGGEGAGATREEKFSCHSEERAGLNTGGLGTLKLTSRWGHSCS